ncbi:MAG TPA: GNAT family N-acetyltransferase [Acidimicrobiales bacterium]|nr:GNAT family N-acetyltransferase [Acidimicrobiales bacterium]
MSVRHRLLVALLLEHGAAAEVVGLRRALRARAQERVAPHVTLVAPVNVGADELPAVVSLLARLAASVAPFEITLGPAGTFAPGRPVVYLAVSGASDELDELRRGAATGPLAPPPGRPGRPFVPHVTLSTSVEHELVAPSLAFLAGYERLTVVTHLHLLEQDLAAAGRPWRVVASPALGGAVVRGRGGREVELSVASCLDAVASEWAWATGAQCARVTYGERWKPGEPFAVVARGGDQPARPGAAGSILGVATGEVRGEICECSRLLVDPAARGEGVGSQLLHHVERFAAEQGCRAVRLETVGSGPAERFYAARGYARAAVLPRWREGRDVVVMTREVAVGG